MRHVLRFLLTSIVVLPSFAWGAARASLDYERRVDAHRAVERVLWERRIWPESNPGPKPPLEEVFSESALHARVDDVLRKSNALAAHWNRPVGNRELQAEIDRMMRSSRAPDVLQAMIDALDRDPVLVAEAIARPALVDRLIRSWYATDARYHEGERRDAEMGLAAATSPEALARIAPRYAATTWTLRDTESVDRRAPDTMQLDAAEWSEFVAALVGRVPTSGSLVDASADHSQEAILARLAIGRVGSLHETDTGYSTSVVLAKTERSVRIGVGSWPKSTFDTWWAAERSRHAASLPDPDAGEPILTLPREALAPLGSTCVDDAWTKTGAGVPSNRGYQAAVWTGSEMIVWGGTLSFVGSIETNTGGRYNPATDSWSTVSTIGAPSARSSPAAVWTGTRMVVWGGVAGGSVRLSTGGRYDPSTDTWADTTIAGAPTWFNLAQPVWTGSRMIVWDVPTIGSPIRGSRYDPVADSWSPMNATTAPIFTGDAKTAVWTGSLLVVWPGKRYNPVNDTWMTISIIFQPSPRVHHTAVWTGSHMIVWGGLLHNPAGQYANDGGRYDPVADWWDPVTTDGAPVGRWQHIAAWVPGRMVIWGGQNASGSLTWGGSYEPDTETWTPMTPANAPTVRTGESVVATPNEMIVWGGYQVGNGLFTNTGGRYNPTSDSWVPTRFGVYSPGARSQHSAVWTGVEMVLFGGADVSGFLDEGWLYFPATDRWYLTGGGFLPTPRVGHAAVWTGTNVLVWGGYDGGYASTGGAYNPSGDYWTPLSIAGAPEGRSDSTAVWSGSRMIVWGGSNASGVLGTGGRYDPSFDQWLPTATSGAPAPRTSHTAVWSGSSMIVWGGAAGSYFNTGGRYDSATDSWTTTTIGNAPTARKNHAAVWTGSRMLIWGGTTGVDLATGSSYDPASNAWSPLASSGAPQARNLASAAWTGTEMLVWGGISGASYLDSGGRYRPDTDTWRSTTSAGAPHPRAFHSGLWAGTEMIVWGGAGNGGLHLDGAGYCACIVWYPDNDGDGFGSDLAQITNCDGTHPAGSVAGRGDCNDGDPGIHPGVADASCDGVDQDCDTQIDEDYLTQPSACGLGVCRSFGFRECIGGQISNSCVTNPPNAPTDTACNTLDDDCDGPVDEDFPQRDDYWIATAAAPSSRTNHTALWSGGEMIVFGGDNGSGSVQLGGYAYAPVSNAWRTLAGGPARRWHHTAVWADNRMVVWGGDDNVGTIYNSGSRYDPTSDSWAPTTATNAPTARFSHSAVWTGTRMVVWGGHDPVAYLSTGSRYDPTANNWTATANTGAPAVRAGHSAVWTGTEMIVWGGLTTGQATLSTGGRYNPTSNTWAATTNTAAPSARYGHVAVWTGSEMLIWGGTTDGVTYLSNGSRYDPATNTWAQISNAGAPGRRAFASAVWTGTELVVWGGTYRTSGIPDTPLTDGARYNPTVDAWFPMNDQIVVPTARARATAVWTGSGEMIVWGGDPNGSALATGGRYNPRTLCGIGGCQQVGLTFCSGGSAGFQCTPLPATPEACDGIDNDCDGPADEGIPVPTAHPAVLATKLSAGGDASYSWLNTPDTTGFDVVRGVLGVLRSSAGNFTASVDLCLVNDLRATSREDAATPASADGYWYLVRPVNLCTGNGTYDETIPPQQGSRDAEISAAAAACP